MLCAIALGAMAALLMAGPAHAQNPKPSEGKDLVAVLALDGVGTTKAEQSALSEELRTRLLKSGKFRIVSRDQTNAVLNEQAFQQQTCVSEDCAVKAGKLLGVHHLITGKVTRIEPGLWQVAAQIVDVESSETLKAVTVTQHGGFDRVLDESVGSLAAQLTEAAQTSEKQDNACKEDRKRLCASVEPGGGRIVECFNQHRADLSAACRDLLDVQHTRQELAGQDCKPDVNRLCGEVRPGGGRIVLCLKQHASELSPACRIDLTGK
jgi:TolB-like protein